MKPFTATQRGLFALHDGWSLAPEGAAVHREEAIAVIADVHLGYEWARGEGGDSIPAHSLAETLGRLERLLARLDVSRLVVAGDLVESPKPCLRTEGDVRRLTDWLATRGVALVALAGNHDPMESPSRPEAIEIRGWTIAHGHRRLEATRTITGHYHPALRASSVSAPCFLVGPTTIVLPAFSPNAAGWNVATGRCPGDWSPSTLRCVACADEEWLDFGPIDALARRMRSDSLRRSP